MLLLVLFSIEVIFFMMVSVAYYIRLPMKFSSKQSLLRSFNFLLMSVFFVFAYMFKASYYQQTSSLGKDLA